jgi:hypothetical protein
VSSHGSGSSFLMFQYVLGRPGSSMFSNNRKTELHQTGGFIRAEYNISSSVGALEGTCVNQGQAEVAHR